MKFLASGPLECGIVTLLLKFIIGTFHRGGVDRKQHLRQTSRVTLITGNCLKKAPENPPEFDLIGGRLSSLGPVEKTCLKQRDATLSCTQISDLFIRRGNIA